MNIHNRSIKVRITVILFCFFSTLLTFGQNKTPTPPPTGGTTEKPKEDVLRIDTNLIQTGVSVFDKKGQFIGNLKQEDFELRVDGKPVPISFFEQAAATAPNTTDSSKTTIRQSETRTDAPTLLKKSGRTLIFLIDDLHITFDSLKRAKDSILNFVDQEMTENDSVAIVSTHYIQQFTKDKAVLRTSVAKLLYARDTLDIDHLKPKMSEYEALLIDRGDRETIDTFVQLLQAQEPESDPETLRETARSRARTILSQTALISRNTYDSMEQAVRASIALSGRKTVLLYSDGFLMDTQNTDAVHYLHLIIDAAARANAVIYSFDAKGLDARLPETENNINTGVALSTDTSSTTSAAIGAPTNGQGIQKLVSASPYRIQAGQRFEEQDGMSLLADSTGGRLIRNTNDIKTETIKAIQEASIYYLLAWQPDAENDKPDKLRRIQVTVKNRPELKVRLQNGYLEGKQNTAGAVNSIVSAKPAETVAVAPKKPALSPADEQLNAAVSTPTSLADLPTSLTANYLDVQDQGATLAAIVKIKSDKLEFTTKGDEASAGIDLLGVIYDSTGKRAGSFRKLLNFSISADRLNDREDLYYNYQAKLQPGTYELRVAARDVKSGRVGSNSQRIEIPDLSSKKLALSSLLLSEITGDAAPRQVLSQGEFVLGETEVSVDRSLARTSQLRYLIFIYNAATATAQPNLTLQTQVLKGSAVVMNGAARQISLEGQDLTRLSYAAEIPLNSLPAGHYKLLITVQDKTSKVVATQSMDFDAK